MRAACSVLVRLKNWERYGLKSWIEATKKRLHHNVLAIALAKKLARIAWAVLARVRNFECRGISHADPAFREELWDRYFTAAPRPRTPSKRQYSDRKLRSKS